MFEPIWVEYRATTVDTVVTAERMAEREAGMTCCASKTIPMFDVAAERG